MATVTFKGPVFDGQADLILRNALDQERRRIMDQTALKLAEQETNVFSYHAGPPTYRYRSGLHVVHRSQSSTLKPHQGIPYVHWIEGTGSRNPISSFKGHWIFKNTRRRLEAVLLPSFQDAMRSAVARIN